MRPTSPAMMSLLLLAAMMAPKASTAGGRVELELAVEDRLPITGRQEWLQRLAGAGIDGFRIRSARPGDTPEIERRGPQESPTYVVTGIITADNKVVLPGRRFSASQVGQLADWLRDLSEMGPPDERPEKAAFGLTLEQFAHLQDDLAPPVGFNTAGMSRTEVIRRIAKHLATPMAADPRLAEPLSKDIVAEDLSALSKGTALAYVLRSPGLCLVPREEAGRASLAIVAARPGMKIWPIGWEPEKPGRKVKPEMFERINVNVTGVTVAKVLETVAERLEMPVLLDHNALARHGLDPEAAVVELPPSRWTYTTLLRKALFQARLKSELRVDDGDRPFLWVTSLKPM